MFLFIIIAYHWVFNQIFIIILYRGYGTYEKKWDVLRILRTSHFFSYMQTHTRNNNLGHNICSIRQSNPGYIAQKSITLLVQWLAPIEPSIAWISLNSIASEDIEVRFYLLLRSYLLHTGN